MKKVLGLFIAICLYANVNNKISYTRNNLQQTKIKASTMNDKLDKIVAQINKEKSSVNQIDKQIRFVNLKISSLEKSLSTYKDSLGQLISQKSNLMKQKSLLESKVIDFISNNYYLQTSSINSSEDLINTEILKVVLKKTSKKMGKLSSLYVDLSKKIDDINKLIYSIKHSKEILQQKRNKLAVLKQQKLQNLKKLQKIKVYYKAELEKVLKSQMQIQNQLAKLKIIQKNQEKQKELVKLSKINPSKIDDTKVKNYGSNIVMSTRTIRYRGEKTIPPVRGIITKKFGYYKDPIYNIDIFNDSITIKTNPNAKVRAILGGKVVFIGDTSEGKMIVISHRNKLHSIYARLSKLSPFIRKGYRVKKGEIIAKDSGKLEFEVTYKTTPINPNNICRF